jgi:hypothetical protein
MSKPAETIRERLAKIKRLAESGSPGERENAARMLGVLLKKHKMTAADLASDETVEFRIDVQNEHELALVIQIVGLVIQQNRVHYLAPKNRSCVFLETTRIQSIEIQELCAHYLPVYRQSAEDHLRAFMSANNLHPKACIKKPSDLTPDEVAAIARAHDMAHAIKPTPALRKRLPTPKKRPLKAPSHNTRVKTEVHDANLD